MTQPTSYPSITVATSSSNEALPPSSAPRISPRVGAHPLHSNPAVQAYHQNLSSHLHSLLRSAAIPGASPASTVLKPPALVETGRKVSDESLSVTEASQVGSGSTNRGGSGPSSNGITARTEVSSSEQELHGESEGADMDGEAVEGDGEYEEEGPQQLTARPELNPRTSLMNIPPARGSASHSATSSASSKRRRAEGASREEDLQQAWKAEGRNVSRTVLDNFTLKMEKDGGSARGSEKSRKRRSLRPDGVGLGIGLGSDGGLGLERTMEGLSIGRSASRGTTTSRFTGGSSYSKSPNLPTTSSFIDTAAATAASTLPSRPTSRQERPLRDAQTVDEKEEYEAKRLIRLERKRGELDMKIREWYRDVQASCTDEDNRETFLSEIIPTPPSPRQSSSGPPTALPSPVLPFLPPSHISLPFSSKSHSFSTKQQPLFVIPPTPEGERPSSIFAPPRRPSHSTGVDLDAKLRALEALMGPTPDSDGRTALSGLEAPVRLGDATIKGRRRSGEQGTRRVDEMDMKTPRVGSGARSAQVAMVQPVGDAT